jgi:hypothetical protein
MSQACVLRVTYCSNRPLDPKRLSSLLWSSERVAWATPLLALN